MVNLTYLSLFSGAGIGCHGFKIERFGCILTNEISGKRLKIQKINNKCKYDSGYIEGDIQKEEIKKKIDEEIELWKKKESIKDIDVIVATPPCQGMSVANHAKKDEIKRNSLIVESIILTKKYNPKFFVFENVRAFLSTFCTDVDGKLKKIKDAIELNLTNYVIGYRIIDFKDYGNPTRRVRTLVIGVRKDILDVSPMDLMPSKESSKTLREVIGKLKSLKNMGEIYERDIYHNFRPYPNHMIDWIEKLKEGESAFINIEENRIPFTIKNGEKITNKNKSGDKYKRCYWEAPGYCIHTRNDILASQWTIHPEDNRVFSIRELMRMMTIPEDFKWTEIPFEKLNAMTDEEKRKFLKKEEMNIRQSIGEAVPTIIFQKIAQNIKNFLERKTLNEKEIKRIIDKENLSGHKNLLNFLKRSIEKFPYEELVKIAELSNAKRLQNAAYYTSKGICFSMLKDLPEFKNKNKIEILEPAVGVGNFIPAIIEKYSDKEEIIIDAFDIDSKSIEIFKILLEKMKIPKNVKINIINHDFLLFDFRDKKYDIAIGNPPYKKITKDLELLKKYRIDKHNDYTNNMFSFFIERCMQLCNYVCLIVPKSLLYSPEFNKTRELINTFDVKKITDYGESAFKIKIETISFILETRKSKEDNTVKIESYNNGSIEFKKQTYIFDENFPSWIIYRNDFFDRVAEKLEMGIFKSFRDRQIKVEMYKSFGKFRILKSRNIENNSIKDIKGYDSYIDDINNFSVKKFLDNESVILVPNLTYFPRATFMPKNCIANGSVAILTPQENINITKKNLEYFSTEEFRCFISIARNYSTRSMNIDSNMVFFFGRLKND